MKKIAFCFLIYDIINHEDLWYIYFRNINKNKYNIYIHYKTDKPLLYFEKYKIKNPIPTEYAHISLVKATNLLLTEALKDPDNSHFIFLSGSCIPLKSFYYTYNFLNERYSYFNISTQSKCFPRQNGLLKFIDKKFIQKASQWCILNRKHSKILITNIEYLDWFEPYSIPDEHAYITYLYYRGYENEIISNVNSATKSTTFIYWSYMNYKYPSDHQGLKNYDSISEEELRYIVSEPCLFGRKFNKECFLKYDFYIKILDNSHIWAGII